MKQAAAIMAVIALSQTVSYLRTPGPPPDHGVDGLLAAYRSVEPMLPPSGVVGFLETAADADFNTVNFYVAQHALAPRVLLREAAATAQFVITTTGAPERSGVAQLDGAVLVGTGAGSVRVFRRPSR